jgi:hypothetical protein
MNLEQIAQNYFKTFENKDIEKLGDMFSDDVELKDWNIFASSKDSVLEANKEIFNSVEKLKIVISNLYVSGMTAIGELLIYADDGDALPVVDVIQFDDDFKIKSIVAYRGN